VVINNAGGAPPSDPSTVSPRFSESIIKLNLIAPLFVAQAANLIMQKQETGGSIVNIASVTVPRPEPQTAAYGAAKAGLCNLTTAHALAWAPKVRVNAIIAGLIRTELAHLHYGDEEGIKPRSPRPFRCAAWRAAGHGQCLPLSRLAAVQLCHRHRR
jgi:NAD(P)-dependent dehydrogenase (short-subunit alcohol dehydrogenase family)